MNFLNLCVTMPNIGAFIFYMIFVILMPIFLLVIKQENLILTYLPLLVPLAIIVHQGGKDRVFQNLYPLINENKVGIVSKYIINSIALVAILYLMSELNQINQIYAVVIAVVNILLIYIYSPVVIPLVMRKSDTLAKEKGISTKYNWHQYTAGFLMLISLVIIQIIVNIALTKFLL